MSNDNSEYSKKYGSWCGTPQGTAPNYELCAESVFSNYQSGQCARKRGHGKGEAYCKQHAMKHPTEGEQTHTMYELKHFGRAEINRVEVQRYTDSSVWIKGNRQSRSDSYASFFVTFEEARAEAFRRASKEFDMNSERMERAREEVSRLFKMVEKDIDQ